MKIGYARVSTSDQSLDQQIEALEAEGCQSIYTDTSSGVSKKRSGLDEALKALRADDILVVWKLDRLGRSLSHLVKTIDEISQRDVKFKSLHDPIDTTTPSGKMVFGIFASLAQFELELIRERTQAGLEAAKKRGRIGGRKPILNKSQIKTLKSLKEAGKHSVTEICDQLNISRKTLYNYLNKFDSNQGDSK